MKIRTGVVAAVLAFASIMACGCSEGASSDTDSSKTESSSVSVSDSSSSDDTSSDKDSSSSDDSSSSEDSSTDSSSKAKKKKSKKKKSSDSSSEADDSSAATTEKTESSAKETTSKASTTTAAETATKDTVKTTAATTAKKPSEQALVWNYNGQCKVTFPASWKGRYVVEGNAVFCKKAHTVGYMGELFRIVSAAKPDDSAEYSYVLGSDAKKNYYFAIINTGLLVDTNDKAAVSEMKSMYSQIESVIKNIRCAGSSKSAPVKYYGYGNFNPRTGMAREGFEPSLNQTLTEINSKNKGLKVTGRFNSKDHSFTYTDSKGKSYKGWYIKKIDENNQSKATPFGLVFLNGCVYQYICPPAITAVDVSVLISNGSVDASGWYK